MKDHPFLHDPDEEIPDGPVSPQTMIASGVMATVATTVMVLAWAGGRALPTTEFGCRGFGCGLSPSIFAIPYGIAGLLVVGGVWKAARGQTGGGAA